jgi:hypothetical protein
LYVTTISALEIGDSWFQIDKMVHMLEVLHGVALYTHAQPRSLGHIVIIVPEADFVMEVLVDQSSATADTTKEIWYARMSRQPMLRRSGSEQEPEL